MTLLVLVKADTEAYFRSLIPKVNRCEACDGFGSDGWDVEAYYCEVCDGAGTRDATEAEAMARRRKEARYAVALAATRRN